MGGQFTQNGVTYEELPNGKVRVVGYAQTPLVANPTAQFQAPQAQANLTRTQLEIKQAQAQASADTRIKNAQAIQEEQKAADSKFAAGDALGDPSLSGPARLASIPKDKRAMIQLLLDNKLQQLGGFALGKPQLQSLLATAAGVNPSFDPSVFGIRYGAMRDFSGGGKNATIVGSAERLALNLQQLKSLSDKMGGPNIGFRPVNSAIASTEQNFEPKLSAGYDALLPEIANQFDLFMKTKGTPTVSGTDEVMKGLRRTQSQDERNASIEQVVKAIRGGLEPIKGQWQSAYGGNSSPPMWISPEAANFYSQIDPEHASSYNPNETHGIPGLHGLPNGGEGPPPPINGGGQTPSPINGGPGGGPVTRVPTADYSSVGQGPNQAVAQGAYRNQYDPETTAGLNALIHKGASYDEAKAYAQSRGYPDIITDPETYAKIQTYAKGHPGFTAVAPASKPVPTTSWQQFSGGPKAAGVVGFGAGATAGLADVAGRAIGGDAYNANRQALAATHPTADFVGNVAGGAAGMFAGGEAASALRLGARARLALGAERAAQLGKAVPLATDIGYGATYGASENPDNPLQGAIVGGVTGGAGGIAARGGIRAVGSAIAPTGGNLAPIFNANPDFRPTIGQRLSASDSRFSRALGMGEQAAESIPALGGIQTAGRSAATDQMQRGAYNLALGEIGQQLPPGVNKGVKANSFLQTAMGNAQEQARSAMQFHPDETFQNELGAWQRNPDGMSLTKDQTDHVQSTIAKAMNGRIGPNGAMAGPDYAAASSDLSRVARNWSGNPSTAPQAAYLRDYISIMDDAAKRASPPEAGQALDAANRGYAKSVVIENAAKAAGGESTEFTGKQLLRSVQNGDPSVRDRAFLRGQALMQDYATAASKLSPSLADSGTPQRLAWMKAGGTGEAALLGGAAVAGHPMALVPWTLDTIANLPGIRNAIGAAMAPRDAILPPALANPANLVGRGLYDNSRRLGMFGAPAALGYFDGQ